MTIDMARARRIAALYRGGANMPALMAQEHMSYTTLRLYLRAARCKIRPRGRPHGSRKCLNPAKVADIHTRLKAGEPITGIARDYGCTREAVSQIARRYGFPVRHLRRHYPLTNEWVPVPTSTLTGE